MFFSFIIYKVYKRFNYNKRKKPETKKEISYFFRIIALLGIFIIHFFVDLLTPAFKAIAFNVNDNLLVYTVIKIISLILSCSMMNIFFRASFVDQYLAYLFISLFGLFIMTSAIYSKCIGYYSMIRFTVLHELGYYFSLCLMYQLIEARFSTFVYISRGIRLLSYTLSYLLFGLKW